MKYGAERKLIRPMIAKGMTAKEIVDELKEAKITRLVYNRNTASYEKKQVKVKISMAELLDMIYMFGMHKESENTSEDILEYMEGRDVILKVKR